MPDDSPRFTWDPVKDRANQHKHGISFDEAKSVFLDENGKLIDDPDHSESEDRFVIMGLSHKFRILMVCHCYRSDDNEIRIISARKASTSETRIYKGE
jgi:uncharacterized DUF497 family protein